MGEGGKQTLPHEKGSSAYAAVPVLEHGLNLFFQKSSSVFGIFGVERNPKLLTALSVTLVPGLHELACLMCSLLVGESYINHRKNELAGGR